MKRTMIRLSDIVNHSSLVLYPRAFRESNFPRSSAAI